jgi:hypothetical protein
MTALILRWSEGGGFRPLTSAAIFENDPTSRLGRLQLPDTRPQRDAHMTSSARILKMPNTAAGRQLLRESILDRRGQWDFPDGSTAENTDWDGLAIDIAQMLQEFDDHGLAVPR